MFGLTFEKLLLVGLIAAVVLGPQRLPVVVGRAAALVRDLRRTVDAARVRAAEEIGVPVDAPQWRALDPRRYDPRRIVAEALAAPSVEGMNATASTRRKIEEQATVRPPTNTSPGEVGAASDGAAPTPAPEAPAHGMRRIRGGTSAHPRWIVVPVDAPLEDPDTSANGGVPTVPLTPPTGSTGADAMDTGPRPPALLY